MVFYYGFLKIFSIWYSVTFCQHIAALRPVSIDHDVVRFDDPNRSVFPANQKYGKRRKKDGKKYVLDPTPSPFLPLSVWRVTKYWHKLGLSFSANNASGFKLCSLQEKIEHAQPRLWRRFESPWKDWLTRTRVVLGSSPTGNPDAGALLSFRKGKQLPIIASVYSLKNVESIAHMLNNI